MSGKWVIRKASDPSGDVRWGVRRPTDQSPIVWFDSFPQILQWKPDCDTFLRGYCNCRFECAR